MPSNIPTNCDASQYDEVKHPVGLNMCLEPRSNWLEHERIAKELFVGGDLRAHCFPAQPSLSVSKNVIRTYPNTLIVNEPFWR